ncbi:MAG: hypothetical protein ACTHMX_03340 [Thermomicrobiales bacterium]
MPHRHRPVPPLRLAPHLLSMAIALMAVVALPLCLPHAAASGLDTDTRTITESRDVVEIVTTPGVHLLHHAPDAQVAASCVDCADGRGVDVAGAAHQDEPRIQPEDLGSRVAVLPSVAGLHDANRSTGTPRSDPARPDTPPAGDPPPPR